MIVVGAGVAVEVVVVSAVAFVSGSSSSTGIGGGFDEPRWSSCCVAAEGTFFLLGTQPPPFPIKN